jgi:predicted nucleic acid-binding protein
MFDINVLLDVFLHRQPHYAASAQIVSRVGSGEIVGVISGHAVTTVYYLAQRQADRGTAETAVDRLIQHFHIAGLDKAGWKGARSLPLPDFEDAVLAQVAEESQCDWIITRNTGHFIGSPVPAISPNDFLCLLPPPV